MERSLRVIVVDDEQAAIDGLISLIDRHCPSLVPVGTADSIDRAVKLIMTLKPDVVFLDVDMPDGSGFGLLDKLADHSFQLVFVTAYDSFGIRAIKSNAVDYLLKPVDLDELMACEKKLIDGEDYANENQEPLEYLRNRLGIPTQAGTEYIEIADIIYIKANGAYAELALANGKIITVSRNLASFSELLLQKGFMRPHRSYMVNMQHIKALNRSDGGFIMMSDKSEIPVARSLKEQVYLRLKNEMGSL